MGSDVNFSLLVSELDLIGCSVGVHRMTELVIGVEKPTHLVG